MTSVPISGLPGASVASTSDIFPIVQSGVTYKESTTQLLQLISPVQSIVWVNAQTGSDSTGKGTAINPYATILHALGTITTNSATKPFAILANGVFTESTLPLKPFVDITSLSNTATSISVTSGSVTLDTSWPGENNQTCSLNNLTFASGTDLDLDFSGFTLTSSNTININNCNLNGELNFTGKIDIFDNIVLVNTFCVGAVAITNCSNQSGSYLTTYNSTFSLTGTSVSNATFWTSSVDIFYRAITVTSTGSEQVILQVTNGSIQSSLTTSGTNAALQYDVASWPSGGLTGQAFPLIPAAINVVQPPIVVTTTYETLPSDYIVNVNSASAITITISDELIAGQVIIFKDISNAAAIHNITLVSGSGATIDGVSSYIINTNLGSVTLIADGNLNLWVY